MSRTTSYWSRKSETFALPGQEHLKDCTGFERFTLKGLKKVELKFGLHALAHNLRKKVA